jgi:zinc-ribbon domain
MAQMCPNCGLPLGDDDVFCGHCGAQTAGGGWNAPGGQAAERMARQRWPGAEPDPPPGPPGPAGPPLTDGAARVRIDERARPEQHADAVPAAPEDVVREATRDAQRLRALDVIGEPTFDPLRNKRFGGQLFRRALLFAGTGIVVDILVFLFLGLVGLVTRSLAILSIDPIISVLVWAAFFIAYLVLPVPALLSQWSRLLGLRAEVAGAAFEYIRQAVHRHATPYDSFQTRTLLPPGEGVRRYLELRRGVFACYISCFPHGRDLYIGWSFWIYMSPFRVLTMKIGRQIQDWSGRGNDMYQTLRYESTRATVGAVHTCMLEGIDVAIRMHDPEAELLGGETRFTIS